MRLFDKNNQHFFPCCHEPDDTFLSFESLQQLRGKIYKKLVSGTEP